MTTTILLLIGFFSGFVVGVIVLALLNSSSASERHDMILENEYLRRQLKEVNERRTT